MPLILLRYILPGLIVSVAVAWLFATVYNNGYNNGENAVRAEQAVLESKRQEAIKHVVNQVEKKNDENIKLVSQIQDQNIKNIFDINRAADDLRVRGLYVTTANTCPGGDRRAGEETVDTKGDGGGASRTRLPEEVEHFLIARLEAADQVVAQYDSCRFLLKELTIQN